MLLMVTSRRINHGEYGDEEQLNKRFDYLYDYNSAERGKDEFLKKGRKGFELTLLAELNRLKTEEGISTPKVGIYLHGYNSSYQESIDQIFDLEHQLKSVIGSAPIIVAFSWPSSGKITNYLSDREEVRDSVGAFTRFLLDMDALLHKNENECFSTSYCIAHSMGNYMLRKGLEYLSDKLGTPRGRKLFDETIMLAPDLASKEIERNGKGQYVAHFSRRVHIYYSKHDRALKASSVKRFGGNRLGRHGANDYSNLQDNIVVINANKYANKESIKGMKDRVNDQVSVHSSHRYQENILKDIVQVILSIDRDLINSRELVALESSSSNNHYKLV